MQIARKTPVWSLLLLGVAAAFATLAAAGENAASPSDPPAGLLLIASRAIQDPRFQHSVILLVRHDQQGAFGIMINRPLGERPLSAVLGESGGKEGKPDADGKSKGEGVVGSIKVYLGGPVELQYGFVVHSSEYHRPETVALAAGVAMTATSAVLRDIGHHQGPAKYLFALGYAGWGKGQLEGEIARHDWFTTTADPDLVFDADRGTVWETALARHTRQL